MAASGFGAGPPAPLQEKATWCGHLSPPPPSCSWLCLLFTTPGHLSRGPSTWEVQGVCLLGSAEQLQGAVSTSDRFSVKKTCCCSPACLAVPFPCLSSRRFLLHPRLALPACSSSLRECGKKKQTNTLLFLYRNPKALKVKQAAALAHWAETLCFVLVWRVGNARGQVAFAS